MDEVTEYSKTIGLMPVRVQELPEAKHIFSHIEWRMTAYRVRVSSLEEIRQNDLLFVGKRQSDDQYAIPSAFSAYTKYIRE